MSPTCDISHGKFYLLSRPGQLMLKKWKKKQCPSANRKSVVLPHILDHISFLSFYPCYPFPPSFFLLHFPPPSSSSSYPSRSLSVSCTSRRRVRVRLGRIHFLWWCIVLLRSFIYCGWPLLNLLLVTEHDKRISSTPLHSSYISQTTQIPHRPCRRETTKPAERITVLVSKSWGRIKHHMLVFFPPKELCKEVCCLKCCCKTVCELIKGFSVCQGHSSQPKKKKSVEQRTQICTYLIFRDNSRFESVGDFFTCVFQQYWILLKCIKNHKRCHVT